MSGEDREQWLGVDSDVCREVAHQAHANLESYRVNPPLLLEQANSERAAFQGGYAQRQLYELVQNGADALIKTGGGRVEVILTDDAFYCANEGEPIDVPGAEAILLAHVSQKRGDEIGRFGLGFKSVLEVTDSPEFYSRSGSFVWDYERALQEITDVVPQFARDEAPAPRLRIAYPIEPSTAFAADPILQELCPWATTIVKLPLKASFAWLADDLAGFPQEFLLFCRHVGRLVLDNRSSYVPDGAKAIPLLFRREIDVTRDEDQYRLREGEEDSTWMLFSTVYAPSAEARHDAGEATHRERVPIHWALPLEGRTGPGVLWAFFPTEYETTLSGIVNAPWKTTSERRNLLDGVFNQELLGVVAQLVVNNLSALPLDDDPGRLLDIIPARGREARNWADRVLTDRVYELACEADSLPDLDGRLRRPSDLSLHPALRSIDDNVDNEAAQRLLQQWAAAAPSRTWCHWSVEQRDRRPRVERLLREAGGKLAGWNGWLEALVERATVEASKSALLVAAAAVREGFVAANHIADAKIVLTREGKLAPADPDEVFLLSDYDGGEDVLFVHPDLAADPAVLEALEQLDIQAVDAAAELESVLRGGFGGWLDDDWSELWTLIRRVDINRAAGIFKAFKRLPHVRVQSGVFRPLTWTLLPGTIIPEEVERDRRSAIDTDYHRQELDLLHLLGAVAAPQAGLGSTLEAWFNRYEQETLVRFRHKLTGRRPKEQYLKFDRDEFAGPLTALDSLSDEGRMLFTEAALASQAEFEPWEFFHATQRDVYPVLAVENPVLWRVQSEGRLRTSLGPRPVAATVGPQLTEWSPVFPVAELSEELAARLTLPSQLGDVSEACWTDALEAATRLTDDALLGRFYLEASKRIDSRPEHLRCRIGNNFGPASPSLVTVVHDPRQLKALIPQKVPSLLVSSLEEAEELQSRWGLNEEQKVETSFDYAATSEPVPLFDQFPALQWEVDADTPNLILVPCGEIRLETSTDAGQDTEQLTFYTDNGQVYYDQTLEPAELLTLLAPIVGFEPDQSAIEGIIKRSAEADRRRRTASIRSLGDDGARLLAAVGEAPLRSRLPKGLLDVLEDDAERLKGEALAELALAVYGIDVLRVYRSELGDQGLEPPSQWGGSGKALAFVRRLGFSREYAGFEQPRRSPLLEVEGPPNVPEPHPYQREIIDEFRRLVRGKLEGKRALLSLPTGAGKTRVAVDALIEAVRYDQLRGPILWVAQSDELCEQAVQTWSFVWRGMGPERERLAVSRLWGGNEVEPNDDAAAHVVVATIQKLQPGCVNDPDYGWLAEAGCVVIDEAHHSTEPSYTALLRWLKLDQSKQTRPLIGLTATPYRGISKEQTQQLVSRYGKRRLDEVAFGDRNPYPILQEQGILAEVEHRLLKGAKVELSPDELARVKQLRVLPPRAEGELGRSVVRNRRILEEIMRLPEDWTILLFATSVDHAQTMAALLTLEGIPSKPISGMTEDGPRRHYIEEFRQKRIRVLTNYNVLTQGFDAPAVRAVIVARPTFSPNLYQQMIGRGLRGAQNGGKDTCLIVNVEDNVVSFGEKLAFRDFEYLWKKDRKRVQ